MDSVKKIALVLIAILSIVLLVSPVDAIPMAHGDDIIYLIAAIASIAGSKSIGSDEDYEVYDD